MAMPTRPGTGKVGQESKITTNFFAINVSEAAASASASPEIYCAEAIRTHLRRESSTFLEVDKSFYLVGKEKVEIAPGIEIWSGFDFSVRRTQRGLCLIILPFKQIFFQQHALPIFLRGTMNLDNLQLSKRLEPYMVSKLKVALKGLMGSVTVRANLKIEVKDITDMSSHQTMVKYDNKTEPMTKYCQEIFHHRLLYPDLQCLAVEMNGKAASLPMELCSIDKVQIYRGSLNKKQAEFYRQVTIESPAAKEGNIKRIRTKIVKTQSSEERFAVQIRGMLELDARELPPPMLQYNGSGDESRVTPKDGQWNMLNKRFYKGGIVDRWTCLCLSAKVKPEAMNEFCKELILVCVAKGMTFKSTPIIRSITAKADELPAALSYIHNYANKNLDLLLVILPDSHDTTYGTVKTICEIELGIVSQCFLPDKILKMTGPQREIYLDYASSKINVKAGGSNFRLHDALTENIPLSADGLPAMIFGADVTHPAAGDTSSPSIAAVTACMSWPPSTLYSVALSTQAARVEIIEKLCDMVKGLILSYKVATGVYPSKIIFYRDGVGDGQFEDVRVSEINAIRKACTSIGQGCGSVGAGSCNPTITFVVVQKRNRTRLFPVDRNLQDKSGNVRAGTVVDTRICHPSQFDFYLCSHAGVKGTSRPMHYHVLLDENKFTADLLQLLTNCLCYCHARNTISASYVAPVLYAHQAAYRARYYMKDMKENAKSKGDKQEIEIHIKIQSRMFFA